MKVAQVIAVLIVISMMLVPLAPPATRAATSGPSQSFSAYVAGSDAAWFVTLQGINVSNSHVASIDSVQGLSWYNLTAIDTSSWVSDFQVFGPQGYDVLPVPFVPSQGAFFTVGADSFSHASLAAARAGAFLLTSFQSVSNSSGTFVFFAPLKFMSIAPSTLLSLFPFNSTGFAGPMTVDAFDKLPSQLVTLEGVSGTAGFTHGLVLGSIVTNALDSSSRPALLSFFGSSAHFIQASNTATATPVTFHFLDGYATSSDNATVSSTRASFSSVYTLQLKPLAYLYRVNASVVQQPATLLATRVIDVGVLTPGSNMSVTISLTNLSNSSSISGIRFDDNWWQSAPGFRLVSGSANVTDLTLAAGHSSTPTYVVQYNGNSTGPILLPATSVSYLVPSGGAVFQEYTTLNPITVSLGIDVPVFYAYLAPSNGVSKSVGAPAALRVFVKNVGTRTATSVGVAGQQLGGLAPGESTSAAFTASAPSLTSVNETKSYTVSYTNPDGSSSTASTNALPLVFSHSDMQVAFASLVVNASVVQTPSGASRFNLTMDFANGGTAAVSSFTAETPLPQGLGCGTAGGTNLTCSGGFLSLHFNGVESKGQEHAWMVFNVTQARNYIFSPFQTTVMSSGYSLGTLTNAQPVPSGLTLTKSFVPSPLFSGMSSTVTVLASNAGPGNIYNASVSTVGDSFDQPSGSARTSANVGNVAGGSDFSFNYSVRASSPARNALAAAVTSTFYLDGTPFVVTQEGPTMSVFALVSSAISSAPSSPVEGRSFTITVTLTNPAAIPVTNVQFLLPIPAGVSLSNPTNATVAAEGLSIALSQLGPGAKYVATVDASASSGETIPFSGTTLSFSYAGTLLKGSVPSAGIAIGENITSRYEIPIALVILVMLATAFYVRRIAVPTAPSSQK